MMARYGEPTSFWLTVVGGIRTVFLGVLVALGGALLPLLLMLLFVTIAPLEPEQKDTLGSIGRGFGGYGLIVGIALALLFPASGVLEGALMRRAHARHVGLDLAGPARLIVRRRSNEAVMVLSVFGIIIGPIGLIVGVVNLVSNSSEVGFSLAVIAINGVIAFFSLSCVRWAARTKDLFSRPRIRRLRQPHEAELNASRSTGILLAVWLGRALLTGGLAMLAPVVALSRSCDYVRESCEIAPMNPWVLAVTVAAIVLGLVLVLVVAFGDAVRGTRRASALSHRVEVGGGAVSLREAEEALLGRHPLELLAALLAGVLAVGAGFALAPQIVNSEFGGSTGLNEFSPLWILPALLFVIAFACWADARGARARNAVFALVGR